MRMRYLTLATDYDGTLATDGQVEPATLAALQRWRQAQRKLILITGRKLDDLMQVCPVLDYFDLVVAENGALLYEPATQTETLLAEPPPREFVQRVRDRIAQTSTDGIEPLSEEFSYLSSAAVERKLGIGRVIVATWEPYDAVVATVIQEMGLSLQVILNKGAVMVLPIGVDKAAGLHRAIAQLGLKLEDTVGVGDAENDVIFLQQCGYAVAVANALPSVKQHVQWVTNHSRGAGVTELIEHLLQSSAPDSIPSSTEAP